MSMWWLSLAIWLVTATNGRGQLVSNKISVHRGDITKLTVDVIVNAAKASLLGGGGVDGAIHKAAGPQLRAECARLNGCAVGQAKITGAYAIRNAKSIIHTVGPYGSNPPTDQQKRDLANCYRNSLELAKSKELRTIAFPCISTGVYNFPQKNAADIALNTVNTWLMSGGNAGAIDKVIFCVFSDEDDNIYKRLLSRSLPVPSPPPSPVGPSSGSKLSVYHGDITTLAIDAVVNAARPSLMGGDVGSVDGAIHRAAGPQLQAECARLNGCAVGQSKVTGAYGMTNVKAIIHTVGPHASRKPTDREKQYLASCYWSSLDLAKSQGLRSIAFPCISTGVHNFHRDQAARIAVNTVNKWLANGSNDEAVDKIVFCVFDDANRQIYNQLMRDGSSSGVRSRRSGQQAGDRMKSTNKKVKRHRRRQNRRHKRRHHRRH